MFSPWAPVFGGVLRHHRLDDGFGVCGFLRDRLFLKPTRLLELDGEMAADYLFVLDILTDCCTTCVKVFVNSWAPKQRDDDAGHHRGHGLDGHQFCQCSRSCELLASCDQLGTNIYR